MEKAGDPLRSFVASLMKGKDLGGNRHEERRTSQIFADTLSREWLGSFWSVPLKVSLSSSHIGPISVQCELSLVCSGEGHPSPPKVS